MAPPDTQGIAWDVAFGGKVFTINGSNLISTTETLNPANYEELRTGTEPNPKAHALCIDQNRSDVDISFTNCVLVDEAGLTSEPLTYAGSLPKLMYPSLYATATNKIISGSMGGASAATPATAVPFASGGGFGGIRLEKPTKEMGSTETLPSGVNVTLEVNFVDSDNKPLSLSTNHTYTFTKEDAYTLEVTAKAPGYADSNTVKFDLIHMSKVYVGGSGASDENIGTVNKPVVSLKGASDVLNKIKVGRASQYEIICDGGIDVSTEKERDTASADDATNPKYYKTTLDSSIEAGSPVKLVIKSKNQTSPATIKAFSATSGKDDKPNFLLLGGNVEVEAITINRPLAAIAGATVTLKDAKLTYDASANINWPTEYNRGIGNYEDDGSVTINIQDGTEISGWARGLYLINSTGNTVTMTGGTITRNSLTDGWGGGVAINSENSTFTMSGGSITENTLTATTGSSEYSVNSVAGAGVCVSSKGSTFIMTGTASISKNKALIQSSATDAEGWGGGVAVSTFTMTGGTINNNESSNGGGGVYIIPEGGITGKTATISA